MRARLGPQQARHYGVDDAMSRAIFADLIRSFLTPYREHRNKPRIAEKTPANALHFEELAGLFPEASFIQIVRDGRDVVASLLTMDWKDGRGQPEAITRDAAIAALAWREHVARGRQAARVGARYLEIRYESLTRRPRETMTAVLDFLGEPWRDSVLDPSSSETIDDGLAETSADAAKRPLSASAIGRWRRDLSAEDVAAITRVAGGLLGELGYHG
jgi:hypothetical protein